MNMNILSILKSFDYSIIDGNLKFKGLIPYGFIEVWDELTTEEQFDFIKQRTGQRITPKTVQFIEEN